jgi:UDP-N-acetylmuramoyl-L-alanyl-D-glutamate--2,6-diaminopimelate ligase
MTLLDSDGQSSTPRQMKLSELAAAAGAEFAGADTEVSRLVIDSREVTDGDLFVAIPGLNRNGEDFIPEALRRGAAAVCARSPVPGAATLVSADPRRALAAMSAALNGYPGRDLRLLGITGSLGKTSTAFLLEQVLSQSGLSVGVIGSLGVRFGGDVVYTRMTTPEAPAVHAALAHMRSEGADAVVMEVTSHSLRLERVSGLQLALGVLTNLVPDEHLEFHATPEDYLATKARFLELLAPNAPLVAFADDDHVRDMVRQTENPVVLVSSERAADAAVWLDEISPGAHGSDFLLIVRRELVGAEGRTIPPMRLPLRLSLLGVQQVANAALAAISALLAGTPREAITAALAEARPIHRRMQVLQDAHPMILDDTAGNAVSLHRVFDAVDRIPSRRLFIVYAIRGSRGVAVNAGNAVALATRLKIRDAELIVTAAEDHASDRDRVTPEERDAFCHSLDAAALPYRYERELEPALREVLRRAGRDDVLLLLGAQGMDAAGGIVHEVLGVERRTEERSQEPLAPSPPAP